MPRHSKPEEAVMAGDGGRAPDVSEQRAETGIESVARDLLSAQFEIIDRMSEPHRSEYKADVLGVVGSSLARAGFSSTSDPASVLAALLAEHPDATVAALETLLTSDEQLTAAHDHWQERVGWRANRYELRTVLKASVIAACRSLRPKAPKEDRDA